MNGFLKRLNIRRSLGGREFRVLIWANRIPKPQPENSKAQTTEYDKYTQKNRLYQLRNKLDTGFNSDQVFVTLITCFILREKDREVDNMIKRETESAKKLRQNSGSDYFRQLFIELVLFPNFSNDFNVVADMLTFLASAEL